MRTEMAKYRNIVSLNELLGVKSNQKIIGDLIDETGKILYDVVIAESQEEDGMELMK